jgi:uncharacterized protein (TIGR02300 family)
VAKPEWGQKRTCQSCGCRFYDLARSPIVCPRCGATVEPDLPFKVRRAGGTPSEVKVVTPVVLDPEAADIESDDLTSVAEEEEEIDAADEEAEDDASLIEDASDLGEDDDDMAEVMEHLDEELEDEV